MTDGELQPEFERVIREFGVSMERAAAAFSAWSFALSLAVPEDIDDDPAFARFCNVVRRW